MSLPTLQTNEQAFGTHVASAGKMKHKQKTHTPTHTETENNSIFLLHSEKKASNLPLRSSDPACGRNSVGWRIFPCGGAPPPRIERGREEVNGRSSIGSKALGKGWKKEEKKTPFDDCCLWKISSSLCLRMVQDPTTLSLPGGILTDSEAASHFCVVWTRSRRWVVPANRRPAANAPRPASPSRR